MAILEMFIVLAVILPPSKSLESLIRPFRSQDLALVKHEYGKQSGIRQVLLERLNKFSDGNSQKLVLFKPNNIYENYSPITDDEKHQNELILSNQYHTTKIHPNYPTTSMTSEVINPMEMNSKMPQILDEWKQIRERRLRFYKAFRKIQNLHHRKQKYNDDNNFMNTNKNIDSINKTLMLNYRQKKDRESSIDPTNTTFNDWETFITDYSKVIPQYNRRQATLGEYDENEINSISNQFLKVNKSTINGPSEYIPQISVMQSFGVARNPLDYQQHGTNFNSAHKMISNNAEVIEHLPPPPNPRNTEASVHTVKVYPPSQQTFSTHYQDKNIYQNNIPNSENYLKYANRGEERLGFQQQQQQQQQQQPISQLISNDYNVDTAYTTQINPDCIDNPCETDNANPFGTTEDEQCNSPRLKQIILQNIMERDAEASKQAIYNVCEAEMAVPCNVICGTGFYSYIARATQFCLISAMDITCYAFLPICDFNSYFLKEQWTKKHHTKV
ncbi:Ground-like domain family protein [Acanthocheilonema viteae]